MSFISQLQSAKALLIVQKIDWLEIVPCCQVLNQYQIVHTNYDFTQVGGQQNLLGKPIGIATQNQAGLVCLYCGKMFRRYDIDIRDQKGQVISNAIKQYKFICFMCLPILSTIDICKPVSKITYTGQDLGVIQYPCWCSTCPIAPGFRGFCSSIQLQIKDQYGNVKYNITAPCLNPGFLFGICGGFNQCCQRRQYKIMDNHNSTIGKIQNIYNGPIEQCCSRADKFGIHFPINATIEDKIRIIHAAIMIDFLSYAA